VLTRSAHGDMSNRHEGLARKQSNDEVGPWATATRSKWREYLLDVSYSATETRVNVASRL
jgi:hypothetical protein